MKIPLEQVSPYAMGPRDAASFLGLGLTKTYELLNDGAFPHRRVGRRTLILTRDLISYLEGIEPAKIGEAAHGK